MTNPFKKYLVELTGEETPQAIEGVSNLKRALVNDKKNFTVEQLEQYDDANAFREAEGSLPTHVSDYYHNREINQFNQAVEQTGIQSREAERDAWVDNDERDTVTGRAKNLAAAGLESAVRQGGFVMQGPFSTYAKESLSVPEDVLEIWERQKNGQELTAEEEARLDETSHGIDPNQEPSENAKNSLFSPGTKADNRTYRDRLRAGEEAFEVANTISHAAENSTIFSNIRNDLDSEFFQQDMAKTAEAVAPRFRAAGQAFKDGNYGDMAGQFAMGLGEMAAGFAGDALENPQAAFEFAAEQAPQLAAGAYSTKLLGAMNVGYASDVYREKVNQFREQNDRLPNREESSSMAGWAATTALAEQIGDVSILRTFQRSTRLSPSVTKVLEVTPDAVQKVAKSGITRTAAAGAKTTAVEAATEAYQTSVETSDISPFDGTADLEEVMVAAGLGGMVGGKIGTTGAAISNTRRALQEGKENRATRANHELTGRYAQEIANGDRPVEDLLNEQDPRLYHPGRATAALTARANDKNLSEEQRSEASAKINEIFDGLNQRAVELREKLENVPNKTERKKISRELKDAELFIETATRGIDNVNAALKQQREAAANQNQDLRTATQEEVTPESQEAAERVIHSMAFNSELYAHNTELSAKIFDELRNSPSVTEEQKQYINNIEASYTAEQALDNASKSAKAVGQDIRKGAPGFKGVLQYRRDTNRALREGNLDKAETEIETLRNFARDHSRKLSQAKIALDQALESGEDVYLFRNPKSDTGWEIRTKSEGNPPWNTRTQQSQVGGFTFNMRGKGARKAAQDFVNVLESEVGLINSLGKELVQAKSLASSGNTTTTAQDSTESGFDESVVPETVAPPAADAGNINVDTREETASSPGPADAVPGTRQESEGSADTANDVESSQETEAQVTPEDDSYDSILQEFEEQTSDEQADSGQAVTEELDQSDTEQAGERTGTTIAGGPADQSWIEATRIRSDSGSPRRVFRGANRALAPEHFLAESLGKNTGHPTSGFGVWFTDDKGVAGRHGQLSDFYLDIRNPIYWDIDTIPEIDSIEDAVAIAEQLQKEGYDGVVYDLTSVGGDVQYIAFSPDAVITADSVAETNTTSQTDTTAEAQAAPAAQEPAAVVEEETQQTEQTEATPIEEVGEVGTYFTQRNGKAEDATTNPLTEIEDFMAQMLEAGEDLRSLVQPFLDKELTDKQVELLGQFMNFFRAADGSLVELTSKERNPDFLHEDLTKLFGQPIPENVRAAVAAAAFSLLIENGGKHSNTNEDINHILGRDSDHPVTSFEREQLLDPVTRHNLTARKMGKRIVGFLNIQAKPDAPADKIRNLEASLGGLAVTALLETDLMRKREVKPEEITDQPIESNNEFETVNLVMLNHDSQDVQNLLETTRGAGNVLGELFGIEQGTVYPPSKPGSFNAKKAIAQGVPAVLAKIMAKVSRRPQKLNAEVGNKLTQFPKEFIGKLAGIEPTEGPNVHKAKEDSIKAKNDAIERDINNWLNFRDYNGDDVFYLRPKMHSQQRVGIEHGVMDPQASKVYRHLMYPQAWETQVDPSKKSSRKLIYFKAAVAQGMGFAVDKKNLQASIDYFDQLMQDPDILAALEALQKDEPTDADQAAILKATKKGGENLWSFYMLVEMAKFQQGANFTTNVMLEIDGVTNGPALTQAMLGTIGPWLGSKLGFMTSAVTNEGIENHTQFKEQGGRDLYETLAHLIQKQLNKTKVKTRDGMVPKDPYISRMTQDILFFTGSFSDPSGRKRAKTPITAMTFGSSESTAVNNMAEELISLYYDQIEEAWASDNVIALEEIQYRINRMIGSQAPQVVELAEPLTRQQENAIKESFRKVMKPAVSAALDEQFSEMKTRRKELYMASKAMFEIYRVARKHLYDQALADSTTVRRDKNGKPIDDISAQEYAEIDRQLGNMMPKMHTAMSKLTDVADRSAGLMLPKAKFTEADRTSPYRQNLQMLRPIKNNLTRSKGKLKESPYMRVQAESLSWEDPRVRAVVMSIHSSDSAIASLTYGEFDALNIHDALGFSLDDVFEGGQKLNQNTFRILADYSPAVELHRALDESFTAFQEMLKNNPELQRAATEINVGTQEEPRLLEQDLVQQYQIDAYRMEVDKLNFLLNLDRISQYSLDGTEYQVTEKDRAIIQKKLEAAQQNLRELGETNTDPTFSEPRTDIDRTANSTPWGRTGVPSKVNDMGLVEMFVASRNGGRLTVRDSVPAKEMAAKLEKRIRETGRSKSVTAFQIGLLRTAMRLINPNMEIRLIRPDTPTIDGIENLQQSVGFYHPDGWIGIKSPEFQDSMITTEMLLHELLHAATSSVMHRIRTGEETDPVAIEAYQGLENLLTKAKAFVQKEGLTEFDNAVSNVDELVSWGLTNQDFQDKVLARIQITPEEQAGLTDRIQRSGFKEFIGKIYRLVFRNKGPHQWRSGLGSLVADASILMKSKAPRAEMDSNGQPIRSMAFEQQSAYSFTPQELFDALHDDSKPLDSQRAQRLKGLLSHLVEAVFQDGAYKENVQRSTPVTAEEFFLESLTDDTRMFHSDIATLMNLNHQEQYVLESTELALRHTLKLNQMIFREADIMFTEMKKKGPSILVRGDWNQLTASQQRYYREIFDSIFKISQDSDGRAAYLSKFLAAAMVYQPLGEAMSQTYIPKGRLSLRGLSFLERYHRLIEWFMSHLRRHVAKTRQGDDYAESTKRMILNMVRLERKRQTKVEKARKRGETGLESKFNKAADRVRSGASTVAQSRLFQNSKFALVRFGSKAAQMTAEDRVGDFMDNLKRLRDGATNDRLGVMGQSWIELRGDDDINAMLTQMLSQTKTIEQMRKRLNIEVHENVDEAFESLSDDESEALTKTLVRSGAFILMDNHSMNEILELVANQATRRKRIKALIQQLPKQHRSYYQTQARALGIHIATGEVKSPMLMRNAHNIAHYLGINNSMPVDPDVAAQAEPIIDEIATLVAIDAQGKSGSSTRNYLYHTAEVMRRELNRTLADDNSNKTNGIEFLLRLQREMDKESRKSLFGDDKTQIVKGYTKDTYDPYIDVVVVKASEGEMMRKAGYKKVEHEILQDASDPRQEKLEMYVARNGGVGQHITGIMSNTDQHRQGKAVVGERRDAQGRINQKNVTLLQQIARNKTDDVLSLIKGNYKSSSNNSLVPVLDTKGNIISWRYMMTEATRDDVLLRNNKVGKVMGNIASSIVDKSQTPLLNKNAVDAVKAIYEQNFVDNSDAFIEFGPKSSDPEIQERYRLLPETTKAYIREVWGRDGMMIRNDTYNILFGYRKASLKQVMEMPSEQRGVVKATLAKLMGEYELVDDNGHTVKRISSRRGKYFMQAENAWEEIVASVKDFWVIKSFSTLVGNETSNATILYLNGVSPLQIPKLKAAAYQQTKDYIRHRREKERLERLVTLGHLSNNDLDTAQQEILHLQALMDASPVSEVMDQGMYQTLVEDVSQEEDPYSYKSQLSDRIGAATQWVPKIARDAVKVGLMTHDTQLYKILNDLTIMSDFTSRVVLNEHLKNRTTKQLSATERQRRVRDAFVDYDVPTSKAMQKLNDTGLVWFSKYYLRIQHVILQLVRENPVRSLQLWTLADWVWSLPDILDSSLLQKDLGNSLGSGAFEMLDAPRELITYKVADDVFFD